MGVHRGSSRFLDFEISFVASIVGKGLSEEQTALLEKSVGLPALDQEELPCQTDFATQVLRASSSKTEICLKWIPPTSNRVERFFTQAKFFLTDYRLAIFPQNLESQLFLHFNRQFWGLEMIQNILAELSDQ